MKKKSLFLMIIAASLVIVSLVFLLSLRYKQLQKNEITALINKCLESEDYYSAKKLTADLLFKHCKDKELLALLDKINQAEKDKNNKPFLNNDNPELKELKGITKLLDALKSRVDSLSEKAAENQKSMVIEKKEAVIQDRGYTKNINKDEIEQIISDGIFYYNSQKYADAIEKFRIAAAIDGENAQGLSYLGASLYELNPENDKTLEEATKLSRKALELEKTNELAHFTLGRIYEVKNMAEEAESAFKETVRHNTNNYMAIFYLGRMHYNNKKYEEAKSSLINLVDRKRDFSDGDYYLALTEFELKNSMNAKENLLKAILYEPNFYKAYAMMGEIYMLEKDYPAAIDNFEKAFSLNKNYNYKFKQAECHELKGETENAYNVYSFIILSAKAEKSLILKCYERITKNYIEKEKYSDALGTINKSLQIYQNPDLIFMSGEIKKMGRYKDAIADYLKVLELNNNNYDAYFMLGESYYLSGRQAEAKKTLSSLLEKKPDYINKEKAQSIIKKVSR